VLAGLSLRYIILSIWFGKLQGVYNTALTLEQRGAKTALRFGAFLEPSKRVGMTLKVKVKVKVNQNTCKAP